MPDKTQYEIAKEIAAMGEKVCEECSAPWPRPGSFEEKRDALDDWLDESTGEVTYIERLNRDARDADEMLEHVIDHFTPRDLWPDKIDEALEAAHQAGERGEALENLDLGLG